MRFLIYVLLLSVLFVSLFEAKDLVVGTRVNNLLISTEKVVYRAIPLVKRDKDYTFIDPKHRIIKVSALYNLHNISNLIDYLA